jgi:hypothetical protein
MAKSRGRPFNVNRAAARAADEKFYLDQVECDFCGTNRRYVSNAACVACSIARSRGRYAALDDEGKAAIKAADHDRYLKRVAESPG